MWCIIKVILSKEGDGASMSNKRLEAKVGSESKE